MVLNSITSMTDNKKRVAGKGGISDFPRERHGKKKNTAKRKTEKHRPGGDSVQEGGQHIRHNPAGVDLLNSESCTTSG